MRVTITHESTGDVLGPFELSDDMKLMDFMALIEYQDASQEIWHNSKRVETGNAEKSLQDLGLVGDAMVVVRPRGGLPVPSASSANPADEAYVEIFRSSLINDPSLRKSVPVPGIEQLIQNRELFHRMVGPMLLQKRMELQAQNPFNISHEEYSMLLRDPDNSKNQARISELIAQKEIDEQLSSALEFTPEVFTTVHMLYISLEINGHPVKAFIDSGAQTTIMSTRLAEKTGLTRLVDKRFRGVAMGVGKSEIIGKIHTTQVKIESQFIPCSFTVLDTNVDMLLGLDMLKRYQACIDLKDNVLRIAGVSAPFLPESEIPKDFEVEASKLATSPSVSGVNNKASPPYQRAPDAPGSGRQVDGYPSDVIKKLMDLGFARDAVIKALNQTNGNAEYAAAVLFQ